MFTMMKLKHILPITALLGFTACTSIDCSLDSVVVWTLSFYDSETEEPLKLPYALTVDAESATTLYNKGQNITSMGLPMSHSAQADTLYLTWSLPGTNDGVTPDYEVTDELVIYHTNYGHFDAMDCPAAVFHTITDYRFESHTDDAFPLRVDSISIIRPQVDYNDVENIRLYLHQNPYLDVRVADPKDVNGTFDVLGGEISRGE